VLVNLIACDIIVPTAFTPNDDDANNYWEIPSIDELYPKNVVYVYNRWGNLLFQSEQGNYASKPWDGKYNGESLSVGSYYFIIELNNKNKEVKKGIISIIK
jgi:gliding motility-associated-like protein